MESKQHVNKISRKNEESHLTMPNWFSKVREHCGKTQREVALALNVTERTVSNWELRGGDPKLTYDQWIALSHLLDCSFEEIGFLIRENEEKK